MVTSSVEIPAGLARRAAQGEAWATWLEALPGLAAALLEEWSLRVVGPSMHGFCSLVLPVEGRRGPLILKIAFPDEESEHEALALRTWSGQGAVALAAADPARRALLLERLAHQDLGSIGDLAACEVVADLYGRLHVPAPARLRTLSAYADRWADQLAALPRTAPLPPRLVAQAVSLARELAEDCDGVLIHTDLHYANVAPRQPGQEWVAIDPKPLSGDPHYELAPMLWNRFEELAGRVRDGVRSRFHTLVDMAGLDEDRARDWVIVRMMTVALWRLQDPPTIVRLSDTDQFLTMCVAVSKAVQD